MKIDIEVAELKALVGMLTPQVVYVEGGPAVGQITSAPGYAETSKVTSEKDYLESLSSFTAPNNGKNGKDHDLSARIDAAKELLSKNVGS